MKTKYTVSAIALATMGVAAPAMAQETVDIDVQVMQVALLEVTQSSATMTIDDNSGPFMGNPSSGGNDFSNVAKMKLSSNYDVSSIEVDFPRRANSQFNGGSSLSTFFGEATCQSGFCSTPSGSTTALGVFPAISTLDASGNFMNGGGVQQFHDGTNTSIVYDGDSGAPSPGFAAGVTEFGLGVGTKWDRTFVGEPTFAEPGTYSITLTATIMP